MNKNIYAYSFTEICMWAMSRVLTNHLLQLEEYTIVSLTLKIEELNLQQFNNGIHIPKSTVFFGLYHRSFPNVQGEIRGVVYYTVVNAD